MNHIKTDENNTAISFPIAIVVSCFNRVITDELQRGAIARLKARGFDAQHIMMIEVPGAVEIPLVAKRVAASGQVQAIIALGAIIRGETSHYDYVCEQVSYGCQRVALDYNLPVIFGVLTTENDAQAWDRVGGNHGHKGKDAADCAIEMHRILNELDSLISR
jgi:6,7-dimethyl-8-ribityllumazine synthase